MREKMKVLYVSHEGALNGAPKSMLEMITGLQDSVEPLVIIPSHGALEEVLQFYHIKYDIVPFRNAFYQIGNRNEEQMCEAMAGNLKAAYAISEIVKKNGIQIIHSNSSVVDAGMIASLITGVPHIWHIREYMEENFHFQYFDEKVKTLLFQNSNCIIAISEGIRKKLKEKYYIESVLAYDGIETGHYISSLETKKKEHFFTQLLMCGSVIPSKGQYEAIQAVRYLKYEKSLPVKLTIVGNESPEYLWGLKLYVKRFGLKEEVTFLPYVNNLAELRENSDFALVCSRMEALGRVAIEAMLAGLPVIGADTGGTKELIGENEERGYLYRQGDWRSLASVIEKAIADKENHMPKIKEARKFAIQEFDLNGYAEKILDIYHKVIAEKRDISDQEKKQLVESIRRSYADREMKEETKQISVYEREKKMRFMFHSAVRWLTAVQDGKSISSYLRKRGYHSVSIYGMGYFGKLLYEELLLNGFTIRYVIDSRKSDLETMINYVTPKDTLEEVDAIIVSVVYESEDIIQTLKCKGKFEVIGLQTMIEEL